MFLVMTSTISASKLYNILEDKKVMVGSVRLDGTSNASQSTVDKDKYHILVT